MSRDKQIEKMAKVIARRSKDFRNPNVAFMTTATKTANSLYNAGYRKASDVAREIGAILSGYNAGNYAEVTLLNKLYELKKKYESEGEG